MKIKAMLALSVLLLLGAFGALAHANDMDDMADWFGASPNDYVRTRSYLGVMGISQDINNSGDFNGQTTEQFGPVTYATSPVTQFTNPELDQVPSIGRNFGFGVLFGQRIGPWAMELSYWQSQHTATFTWTYNGVTNSVTNPATLQSVDINIKRYIFTQLPTQPFISLGLSVPWLNVTNGSEVLNLQAGPNSQGQYSVSNIGMESISGIGVDLGVGLEIYLSKDFSLVGGAYQRWTQFNQINGAEKISNSEIYPDGDPNPTLPSGANNVGYLEGDGINFYVGSTIGFE